jgi:hypothetical protein
MPIALGKNYFRTAERSFHQRIQNSSGAHPASYPMCTRGSFTNSTRLTDIHTLVRKAMTIDTEVIQCRQASGTNSRSASSEFTSRTRGVQFLAGAIMRFFSLHFCIQTGSGVHPADHSPPSSVEVRNAWSYTSTPRIRRHSMVLN